jgi:PAS domain S-box-containing protein
VTHGPFALQVIETLASAAARLAGETDVVGIARILVSEIAALGARACWIQPAGAGGAAVQVRGLPGELIARLTPRPDAALERAILEHTGGDALWVMPLDADGGRLATIGAAVTAAAPADRSPSAPFLALVRIGAAALARATAEAALARRRTGEVLDAVCDGIYGVDRDGRTTFANRAACELTGWPVEAMLGRSSHELVHHHRRDGTPYPADECPVHAALRDGQIHRRDDDVYWRRDGTSVDVASTCTPLRDDTGAVRGGVVTFRDVTAERQADAERDRLRRALDDERRILSLVLEALPVGVWITDATGRIVHGNPAGLAVWEGARYVPPPEYGEYRGWWPDTGRRIGAHEWALARAIERGETSIDELIEIETFRGNRKHIRNSALPIRDDAGQIIGAIVVNEDVSERVEHDRLREEWISIIAHDLRQPVSVIGLRADLLADELAGARPALAPHAEHIRKSARALDRLIGDLLDVSRLEAKRLALDLRDVDPVVLVHEVVDRLSGALRDHPVRIEAAPTGRAIVADPARLEQVLGNLLTNAAKYGAPRTEIVVGVVVTGDELRVSITNVGDGIAAEDQPRLFRRFQRTGATDQAPGGIGLGLYIAKGIVEAHGGRIWVVSVPGGTTTFHVALPAPAPRAAEPAAHP